MSVKEGQGVAEGRRTGYRIKNIKKQEPHVKLQKDVGNDPDVIDVISLLGL